MTDLELQRIERAIRKAVTAVLEREVPISMAIRAAAVSLLQGDPDPAVSLAKERPSERCTRRSGRPWRLPSWIACHEMCTSSAG